MAVPQPVPGRLSPGELETLVEVADPVVVVGLDAGASISPSRTRPTPSRHGSTGSGLPDEDYSNVLHAIVELAPGSGEVSDDELRQHLTERLVSYKIPRSYQRSGEPLCDDAGNLRRSALRAAWIR